MIAEYKKEKNTKVNQVKHGLGSTFGLYLAKGNSQTFYIYLDLESLGAIHIADHKSQRNFKSKHSKGLNTFDLLSITQEH